MKRSLCFVIILYNIGKYDWLFLNEINLFYFKWVFFFFKIIATSIADSCGPNHITSYRFQFSSIYLTLDDNMPFEYDTTIPQLKEAAMRAKEHNFTIILYPDRSCSIADVPNTNTIRFYKMAVIKKWNEPLVVVFMKLLIQFRNGFSELIYST